MPTTIYTKQPINQVSHKGKHYAVVDGAVDVPDDAVDTLCEAHGFSVDKSIIGPVSNPISDDIKQGIEMPVDKPVNKGGRPKRIKPEEEEAE